MEVMIYRSDSINKKLNRSEKYTIIAENAFTREQRNYTRVKTANTATVSRIIGIQEIISAS